MPALSDAVVAEEFPFSPAVDEDRDPELVRAATAVAELVGSDSGGLPAVEGEVPLDAVLRDAARRDAPPARSRQRVRAVPAYRAPAVSPGERVPVLGSEFRGDACWVSDEAAGGADPSPLCADEGPEDPGTG